MSGGSVPMSRTLAETPAQYRGEVERDLGPLDPMRNIAHSAPSRLLFQDGVRDEIVTHQQLLNLYRAAGRPKEIRWYEAGHLLDDRAMREQLDWLARQLRLDGSVVPGARSGP